MDPQNQVTPVQVTQPVQQEVKKCSYLPVIIVLVILLIGSCAFGGYELWNGLQKDSQITKLEESGKEKELEITQLLKENKNLQEIAGTNIDNTEEVAPISIEEADKILEKYLGISTGLDDYRGGYRLISYFNDNEKIFFAYNSIPYEMTNKIDCIDDYYEDVPCVHSSISFDILDEKYKSLFGNYGSVEKKNYVFESRIWDVPDAALVYDSSINAYRKFVNGQGGDVGGWALHKVISVEKENKNVVATVFWAEFPGFVPALDIRGLYGSNDEYVISTSFIEKLRSTSIYKFKLSPYNGSYVLTDISKESI